jgi:hypothetical protein
LERLQVIKFTELVRKKESVVTEMYLVNETTAVSFVEVLKKAMGTLQEIANEVQQLFLFNTAIQKGKFIFILNLVAFPNA